MLPLAEIIRSAERHIRPSNLFRLTLCNGCALMSAAAVAIDGEEESAPEAALGNLVHDQARIAVEKWKAASDVWPASWDQIIEDARDRSASAGLDSWSIYCVTYALGVYRYMIEKYEIEPENVMVEQRLPMQFMGLTRDGSADLVLLIPHVLAIILDIKAGFVDQGDADEHDQIAEYGSAAAEAYQVPRVIVGLVQPRAESAHRLDLAEFDADALRATAEWSRSVVAKARKPSAELTPGFTQCATCPALRRCEAAKEYIVQAIEGICEMREDMTAEEWGHAIGAAKLAEKWAEKVKDAGKDHLKAGGQAVGFKLGTPRAMRFCINVPLAVQKIREAGMEHDLFPALSISIGRLPPATQALIADNIGEKLSEPPLTADKRKAS